jgi:hypothetical protein
MEIISTQNLKMKNCPPIHATHAGDGADAADAEDWAVQCQQCCIEKEKALDEAETKKKLVP